MQVKLALSAQRHSSNMSASMGMPRLGQQTAGLPPKMREHTHAGSHQIWQRYLQMILVGTVDQAHVHASPKTAKLAALAHD